MNPIVMAIVAAAIFVAGGLAAHETIDKAQLISAQFETANLKTQVETNRANANQRTIDAFQASLANVAGAEDFRRNQDAIRARALNKFLEALSHVPDSKSCAASPAFRTVIDSVRAEGTAGANH